VRLEREIKGCETTWQAVIVLTERKDHEINTKSRELPHKENIRSAILF
jgi:hypothetical protein